MVKRTSPIKIAALGLITAAGLGVVAFVFMYELIGHTPREVFDYVEQRLQGHPKLESVALPVIGEAREYLNEPSQKERRTLQFNVPPPPPLRIAPTESPRLEQPIPGQRVIRVGKEGDAMTIALAAKMAKDGDIVEIAAGNYYGDVTTWRQRNLTIRGVGGHARLYADGKIAEGKAIWVMRNGNFLVENIDFIGAKAHDKNGAGIRFEDGTLHVKNCLFHGNESGILTGNRQNIIVTIENSEFGYNGTRNGLSHSIYAGSINTLTLTGNYLHHANTGHLVKSRAKKSNILYNRITDESGWASYEVNLPNGGNAILMGNIIQQGRETENSTIISYGEEGYKTTGNNLKLINNTIVNDHPYGGTFIKTSPGTVKTFSLNNLYIGKGAMQHGDKVDSINDKIANWEILEQPQRFNYELNKNGLELARIKKPPEINTSKLDALPSQQYLHPAGTRKLKQFITHIGAVQPTHWMQ